jgi:spore germination cell wall hydrolase CwlJ-like protein
MHQTWLAACVVIVALAGCQPPEGGKGPPAANDPKATEKKAEALERNAAAEGDNKAPSSSEIIGKPDVQAVDPLGKELLDDPITCLARTIYWEARGEKAASMEAVASIVMNRLGHGIHADGRDR